MITKVVPERGARTRGLLEYLWGPGRANEHVDPRIVAAWDSSFVRDAAAPILDGFERGLLAREMEAPLRMFDKEMGAHVYHTAVSIHADDGELTDEQWAEVAERAAEKLGFTEGPDRAAVPWIAMRHGKSAEGNDHIHFVAVLCREDGRTPSVRRDFHMWREVREEFAAKWQLRTGRERGAGMPGLTQAEIQRADREGQAESPRTRLARLVRAAATGAQNEAEWLRRVRRSGVLIRPRWAPGGRETVVGYSVALRPERAGYKPVWFGGGKLAPDLTIDRLRERWAEPDEDLAAETLREWRPPGWRQMPTARQLQRRRLRAAAWDEAATVVGQVREQLAHLDPADTAAWAGVAREAAGALSALAARVDGAQRGQLSRAADALARAAQTGKGRPRARRDDVLRPLAGVARAVADATLARHGGPIAVASLVAQLGRLVQTVERVHRSMGRRVEAEQAERATGEMLRFVRRTPRPVSRAEAEPRLVGDRFETTQQRHDQRGDEERGR